VLVGNFELFYVLESGNETFLEFYITLYYVTFPGKIAIYRHFRCGTGDQMQA
jgi:hypothetical protein